MPLITLIKKNYKFLFCLFTGFIILTMTSRSSFFYPYNNWDDANSYFTMGKGMMNGMVIYRDLYDQKGPFLYLLYGFGYLISNKSFLGIYIFEIIAGALFLYFAFKIIERHSSSKISMIIIPLLAACVYSSKSFYWGGAAEEFCLPAFAYTLYVLDFFLHPRNQEEKNCITNPKLYLIVGILTGVIALIKYTMLGFFFAFGIIAGSLIIYRSGLKKFFHCCIVYISGIIIPFIPWLIYFGVNGALDDWYRCYIYNNLFFYSDVASDSVSLYDKIYKLAKLQYWLAIDNSEYFLWIIAAFILALCLEKEIAKKIAYLFMYATTFFVIFAGGGTLPYYSIPLMALAIPGAAYISDLLQKLRPNTVSGKKYSIAVISVIVVSTVFAKFNCLSSYYFLSDKQSHWLTKMASQITVTSDTSLLNVGCLDVGLYTITGIVPTCEYFQTNGIALPTLFSEQQKYISEGKSTYVIAGEHEPEGIYEKYELVDSVSFYDNSYDQVYYLYKRK